MFAFLKPRILIPLLGFVLLALFIWYGGPYFAFADFHPLESTTARLIAIGAVLAIWAVSILLKRLRANRASGRLINAVMKQPDAANTAPSAEAQQLRERFEEAAEILKKSRRGKQNLYALPWYVIIGAPGSGKTTALANSGLNFPLAQRFGKEALRGVGGTRNCDWWFTDEAVLLDTAGRYTTQDSDQNADSAAWAEFLALLRRYRKRRPLNGVMLTLSAADLMTQSPAEREAHIGAARRRLDELNRQLRIKLPVYLLITKCDLVAGFTEYFEDLSIEGRAQVWGVTFAYQDTLSGKASQQFSSQFDALIARLNERLFARLEEERDARRRAKIFAFPQQVAALRDLLDRFVGDVFTSTGFEGQVLLRGVYFTSGTQEGSPIDRLLGALSRTFAVTPGAVASAASGRGKAYFIEKLLKGVMFAECGLAGVNRRLELQKAALQLGLYAVLVLVAIVGVVEFLVSYSRNQAYLHEVAVEVAKLKDAAPIGPDTSLEEMLPWLDNLRAVAQSANRYREHAPVANRWGLYQGSSIGNAATDAYLRELDATLLPKVADRLQHRLIENTAEPDKLYEYLKAYLMLGQPEHLDKAQLGFLVDLEWKKTYGAQPDVRDSLSRHFHSLLDNEDRLRVLPIDQRLVDQARSTIRQASIARLMYSRLKLNYAGDDADALRLDVAAGLGFDKVFTRKSGKSLAEPVPGLYTRKVFDEVTGKGTAELVKQFAQDAWVLGEGVGSIRESAKLGAGLIDIYEKDYIAVWDSLLNDIQVQTFPTIAGTTEALGILAAPTSPLRGLLQTVDANTHLVQSAQEAPKGGLAAAQKAVEDRLGKLLDSGKAMAGVDVAPKPGAQVAAHFEPIHQLVAAPPGTPAKIDAVLAKMGQIQQQLLSVGSGLGETNPLQALARSGRGDIVKSMQQDAALLPPVIGTLISQIGGRTEAAAVSQARSELESRYQQDVMRECTAIINGRYPFSPGSAIDVPVADFGRLFAAGGVFDAFFKANLEPLIDTSRSPWTWRSGVSGSAIGISANVLRQFEAAQRIRDVYFRPGAQLPEMQFTVTPVSLDAAATKLVLEIDGQSFEYRHGPERSLPAKWPGPSPGAAAVSFEDRAGAKPNLVFQGPWAWFRLLDAGHPQPESDVRYAMTFQMGGHDARIALEATSIRNPFAKRDLQQFRCTP